jgi:hypothetical protein
MKIKSIVTGAAISLIASVGSVSADENDVDGTAVNPGTPFAVLDGIAAEQMSVQELAAIRGAAEYATFFTLESLSVSNSFTKKEIIEIRPMKKLKWFI